MRSAFTLVELVVVILILGILAGVAAPRMFNFTSTATDQGVKESLGVVRAAIERFMANNGRLPGDDGNEATFKAELEPYLRKFPVLAVGPAAAKNDGVAMDSSAGTPAADASPTQGWRFYYTTGDFIINVHEPLASDSSLFYDEL